MKAGDVVTIYEDPYTCQRPEGEARLERRISDGVHDPPLEAMNGAERWEVRFRDDLGGPDPWECCTTERLIVPKELAR